ncbi:phosphotriesterase [Paenactinomyces guangxiensis]|uniref:Phosphotriesterase n=1 Tax=Paenactinomyces guangxiensis TaxID=1490290 RepID=A0A7W1WNM2_9BACL|nr:phosphotriesterase [Paenactinomyces guangxiensis]MBA4493221.1 phosphotriesterase [Paenactinomyces guangxiensis]MBH8589929.1 phosphotriesterase [Paenactinomyces guangxiensis]
MIQTVTGTIEASQLGICAVHEHCCIDLSHVKQDPDTRLDDRKAMVLELQRFARAGGRSIIEVTNVGMGRDVLYLRELSLRTGLQIIASTGCYKDPYLPEEIKDWDREQFAEFMVKEIREGIDGTGIFPGVIGEVGSSLNEITAREQCLLEGAGLAGMMTGLPVTTHTTLGTMALQQIELFSRIGLPMDQLIIGHQDLNQDRQAVFGVVEAGAYVAFDTIGKNNYLPDRERVAMLLDLWERGYGGQVLLSADLTRKSHFFSNGGPGYDVVLREFVPMLNQAGFTAEQIRQMLIDNPASAFAQKEVSLT